MNARVLFGLSVLLSFAAWGIVAILYLWPQLRSVAPAIALMVLMAPHMFRFVGLNFLLPGVVSASLPAGFARPAAYGDLIAALLAIGATLALAMNVPWAVLGVWIFNIWGAADLVNAMYRGPKSLSAAGPGALGAAIYIPTLIVPGLLVSHILIFHILLSGAA